MAVGLHPPGKLLPVQGIKLASMSAGIYSRPRQDLVLIELSEGSRVSSVFTRNKFAAAPVIVARMHNRDEPVRFCLINAGNANAGTGSKGIEDALLTCRKLAGHAGCRTESVLPFSTGVIGQDLPVGKIVDALPALLGDLSGDKWNQCSEAIMTTDTIAKGISRQIMLDGRPVTITGIAKGSGMIRPDMATMLAFIGTDAAIQKGMLDRILGNAVAVSFNRICVDGDMSTNDACVLMATGEARHSVISNADSQNYHRLETVVREVCIFLATAIVRDGEGATKFISINVNHAASRDESLAVAYTIATSPLVKTAFFASDPNWGRILAAIGRADVINLDIDKISIYINGCCIVKNGSRAPEYTEESGKKVMLQEDIVLQIDLGRGESHETVWTCDLSHEYVRINAEYRS